MDHPRCTKCGSTEFQLVEDVQHVYRRHEFIGERLVFSPDVDEMCWDACASVYQYVECRQCCTRLEAVPFAFSDDDTEGNKP